ncbi:MAG: 5-formyltetrahydrofolate cyclo-ligase [Natronospirillum sp.]|uniref:5-formyltetrahydrofolate cyclo-ligase n=1 Tax=Natronospirillum sp. TaxID=2812955 RepID=UPI0025D29F48|nr:5-formyltetrahydrofolate cyclo-ligase [Natronospirillum sp.]MCH8552537.1 5-formyltetrahydrofolate cyclo-ligase [Natronospirillum sp.]
MNDARLSAPRNKNELRQAAYAARGAQPDRLGVSQKILGRALTLPEACAASTILWYISCRTEVVTTPSLEQALGGNQRVVIPFCTVDYQGAPCLGLWHLKHLSELVPGTWNIPEPPRDRWDDPKRIVAPEELDLVLVPGVAFSPLGDRLGNGAGYYDRLLPSTRPDCCHVGIAFECQVFHKIPTDPHDRPMHYVLTEKRAYGGSLQADH